MSIWIQITAGRGPVECCLLVAHIAKKLEQLSKEYGSLLLVLEQIEATEAGAFQSIVLLSNESVLPEWLKPWLGTIQWVCQSPCRPQQRRKNWFAGVQILQEPESNIWRLQDVRIETIRSSGPGGQNVNKIESAVRATHTPSGLTVLARECRSQKENRQLAIERLKRKLQSTEEATRSNARRQLWQNHSALERGNPVKVFSGAEFLLYR